MGCVVMGKIECGMVKLNDKLTLMPNKIKIEVTNIYCEDEETDSAICGENVKLKLKGIDEEVCNHCLFKIILRPILFSIWYPKNNSIFRIKF